jgi:hypothetical protein
MEEYSFILQNGYFAIKQSSSESQRASSSQTWSRTSRRRGLKASSS